MHVYHAITMHLPCSCHAFTMQLLGSYHANYCVRQTSALHAQAAQALQNKAVVSIALPASS